MCLTLIKGWFAAVSTNMELKLAAANEGIIFFSEICSYMSSTAMAFLRINMFNHRILRLSMDCPHINIHCYGFSRYCPKIIMPTCSSMEYPRMNYFKNPWINRILLECPQMYTYPLCSSLDHWLSKVLHGLSMKLWTNSQPNTLSMDYS